MIVSFSQSQHDKLKQSKSIEESLELNNYITSISYVISELKSSLIESAIENSVNDSHSAINNNGKSGEAGEYVISPSSFDTVTMQDIYGNRISSNSFNKADFSLNNNDIKDKITFSFDNNSLKLSLPIIFKDNHTVYWVGNISADKLNEITTNIDTQIHLDGQIYFNVNNNKVVLYNTGYSKESLYYNSLVQGTPFHIHALINKKQSDYFVNPDFTVWIIYLFFIPIALFLIYSLYQYKVFLSQETKFKEIIKVNKNLESEISSRNEIENKLTKQANYDDLTNLPNRKYAISLFESAIEECQATSEKLLAMFIDLDNFKGINDIRGHLVGDELLKQVSTRLKSVVGESASVARLSGDEFLVLLPKIKDDSNAILENIKTAFNKAFLINNEYLYISASMGISRYPEDGDNATLLLNRADMAMYRTKNTGRNGYNYFDTSLEKINKRNIEIDMKMRKAIINKDLEVYYQPIIDISSGKIISAEALLRWNDDELGFISPSEFIPIAEKNGMIMNVGEFVLLEACKKAREWHEINPIIINVNFSSIQFRNTDILLRMINDVLHSTALDPKYLNMEITETVLIDSNGDVLETLNNLKRLGVGLSLDDFGTGYSTLSYLQKFPFDKLKIDRSFFTNLEQDIQSQTLVNAVLAMAKSLGLAVVAEGVEDKWTADYLSDRECHYAQGYYYSKPVDADLFTQYLLKKHI
ncbi:putative bifunctional diguanylate cyclase/phosphodiesterase [Vibrio gallicus]|uniref:putative bifunctional diguanylate cyclase/phosphodiesterase n=1 Tax=Vibrio gallicus TaxID=190897 RepID=UPI0021C4C87B|nr:EAL domain-containing protein [Vibrio gallicus]